MARLMQPSDRRRASGRSRQVAAASRMKPTGDSIAPVSFSAAMMTTLKK
jgi:hypothetical protein